MKLRILIAGLVFGLASALAAESGAELFQKAVTQERAAGNLEEAIKLYQRVAKEFASDRPLAAKALVQAAHCYELLGQDKQDKAVQLYEQIARDFGDQRQPVETARAKLAALRQANRAAAPATMTQRKIELDPALHAETDGQRQVYVDAATGALTISDLTGKNRRVIFKPKAGDQVGANLPSRDLSAVVFDLKTGDGSTKGAVIKTDGSGYRELEMLSSPSLSAYSVGWSWDNRFVTYAIRFPDGTHRLLRTSVADGSTQELLRGNNYIPAAASSPDGRFIAYSQHSLDGDGTFVLPSQGGEPQLISGNALLLDWTRDGRYLAVASPHSGATALHLLPVRDGKPAGDPVFVRYGSFVWGSSTASGALVYLSYPGTFVRAWIADLDPNSRPGDWKSLDLDSSGSLWPVPTWSPDSSQIVWTVGRRDIGQVGYVSRLRNFATGKERDLYRGTGLTNCVWASRHSNVFCSEVASDRTTTNIFSIAVDSGRTEQLGAVRGSGFLPSTNILPNDQALYFVHDSGEFTRWDIGTGQETLLEHTPLNLDGDVNFSPDGSWAKRFKQGNIETRPMAGGDWKPLLPLRGGGQSGFSPDGKWVFYHDVDATGKDGLYRVATGGGAPERLGDFPARNVHGTLRISPDGRKIIALTGADNVAYERWLLENFEPKQAAAK